MQNNAKYLNYQENKHPMHFLFTNACIACIDTLCSQSKMIETPSFLTPPIHLCMSIMHPYVRLTFPVKWHALMHDFWKWLQCPVSMFSTQFPLWCFLGFLTAGLKAEMPVFHSPHSSACRFLVLCACAHRCIKRVIGRDRPPHRPPDRLDLITHRSGRLP